MQPLALYVANSLFSQGYLTTGGQGSGKDEEMMRTAGFEPEIATKKNPNSVKIRAGQSCGI